MLRTSRVRSIVATLLFSSSVLACGGGSSSSEAARGTGPATADDPSCPVSVPGTSVNVEDTDTGAALVFVTTGDVAELRKRVTTMAQMHNDHHGSMGALPDGTGGGGDHAGHDMSKMGSGDQAGHDMSKMGSGDQAGHDMSKMGGGEHAGHAGGMIGVHSKASAAEVPNGAKIAFIANGADVARLQSELRVHAKHFSNGTCKMGSQ